METSGTLVDGRYRVLSVLGTGAQGVVVRAVQEPLGREVALKVLSPGTSVERVRGTLAVARLLAAVDHPNLPLVHAWGGLGDGAFVAMELVEGPSLAQVLARHRRLAPADAVPLFRQIAAGLACAHDAGVVHRDVKPANVLLASSEDGDVVAKLVDFGVAATRGGTGSKADVIGTPVYMAPEQGLGAAADPRADLYALGVLMFRTLTGYRPFHGDDAISAAVNHLIAPVPSFAELVPGVGIPEALERVVRRCLEKDPALRYPDADALLADLDALDLDDAALDDATMDATLPPTRLLPARREAAPAWLLAAVLAAGTVIGLLLGVLR